MSNVGRVIHGYCNGYFGRDSYHDKRIEAEGYDWVVVREDGEPNFCYLDPKEKQELLDKWSIEEDYDD